MDDRHFTHAEVERRAAGWGSAKATIEILIQERVGLDAGMAILRQNKHDGFTCVSCSWAKPAHSHSVEACENGIKATAGELTSRRPTPEVFLKQPVAHL